MAHWDDWLALAVAITIPFLGGFFGGSSGPDDWYRQLSKPWFTPPGWVFPVVWTYLYITMGIASWLIWKRGGFEHQIFLLGLYAAQLAVNFLWTPLFFQRHRIDLALLDIIALWLLVLACTVYFYHTSRLASYLFVPYLVWVSIATALNFEIWRMNPSSDDYLVAPLR